MLAGKIIVAIAFGGLSFWGWKNIWNGLYNREIPSIHIKRKISFSAERFQFVALFSLWLGIAFLLSCILVIILLPEEPEWSHVKTVLARIGIIIYMAGSLTLFSYAITEPVKEYWYREMNTVTKIVLIALSESLRAVYWGLQIVIALYFILQ